MEQLNYVHLRGTVGRVNSKRIGEFGAAFRFSLATEYIYRDKGIIIETTWHSINFVTSEHGGDYSWLTLGAKCEVEGRLHNTRYTDSSGRDQTIVDVVASNIKKVEG